MCLDYSKAATEKLRARMIKKGGTMRFWKMVGRNNPRHELAQGLEAPYYGGRISFGVCRSNRRRRKLTREEVRRDLVWQGTHVFCRREDAAQWARRSYMADSVLCVTASADDLVGAGVYGRSRSAVFMKVHITQQAYNAALRKAQK